MGFLFTSSRAARPVLALLPGQAGSGRLSGHEVAPGAHQNEHGVQPAPSQQRQGAGGCVRLTPEKRLFQNKLQKGTTKAKRQEKQLQNPDLW